MSPSQPRKDALLFAISSVFAVGAGCLVVVWTGGGAGMWMRNVAAWLLGALLAQFIARIRPNLLFRGAMLLTPLVLLLSLTGAGQQGVHRWIRLGPLHWNVAFLCLPVAVVAFAWGAAKGWRWTGWSALAIEGILCLQPDVSQATAFAAAVLATQLTTAAPALTRLARFAPFVGMAAFAWTRPDPLLPVPEVEGILTLAATLSPAVAFLCVASLAAASALPHFAFRRNGTALSLYFLTCSLMPLCGAFPVPLVGMGMGPILGFWLGIGSLLAVTPYSDADGLKNASIQLIPN